MRVYSLTDVPTHALRANGLVGATVRVGPDRELLAPGHVIDVPRLMPVDQRFVSLNAIALDRLPQTYLMAKAKLAPAMEPVPDPTPPAPPPVEKVTVEVSDAVHTDDTVEVAVGNADTVIPQESEHTPEPATRETSVPKRRKKRSKK